MRRGILPNARMRHPTLTLDQTYQNQMDDLVAGVVALAEECRKMKPAAV
jgi:hypothetical protein